MEKKNPTKHHKKISFEKEGERSMFLSSDQRMLTAEGFRRRSPCCQATRSMGIYRGRRQGKKGQG